MAIASNYCDPAIHPFVLFHGELVVQGFFLVLVCSQHPAEKIMSLAHSSYIGLAGCLCYLQECMFLPGKRLQMKDFVGQCNVCLTHRDLQVREPILQHKVSPCPWAKVAVDPCYFSGQILLVVVTTSIINFIEV